MYPPRPGPYPPPYSTAYPVNQEAERRATTGLWLGIVSLVICQILGPIALYMGLTARRDGAGGNATAAIIMGGISTALFVLSMGFAVLFVIRSGGGMPPGF